MSEDYKYAIFLTSDPINTKITFSPGTSTLCMKAAMNVIRNVVKAHPEGYQHMPKYKAHMWDGFVSLLEKDTFPTGLVNVVMEALEEVAEEYEYAVIFVDDKLRYPNTFMPELDENYLSEIILRDYQLETIRRLVSGKRGIAHLATNSGKTVIIAALCKIINGGSIVLTHKKELLYQTSEVIHKLTGLSIGLVGDGHFDLDQHITVAMVQTLAHQLDSDIFINHKDTFTTLIIDECHHTSSRTMMDVVMHIDAPYRFGFSGTPLKYKALPDLQLTAATGPVLIRVDNELLIQEGYSAKPEILLYEIENDTEFKKSNYSESYDGMIVNNSKRNDKIVQLATNYFMKNQVILILVEQLEHQTNIYKGLIRMVGSSNVTSMNGSQSMEFRKSEISNMRSGKSHIYIATEILGEGVDIPAIDVLMLASGGKSHIRLLQRVGRGMRKKGGDNKLVVIDFIDHGNKYLERHSKARINIYNQEGFPMDVYK